MIFDSERSGAIRGCIIADADKKPRIESTHLFQGEREIVIVHQDKRVQLANYSERKINFDEINQLETSQPAYEATHASQQ